MACARSSAHRSATSATTTITAGSRRGSVHTVQGFCVSMLPQVRHTWILSIAVCSAAASGLISCSRFLMRKSAARRAERGPSPGRRASSWIRRSISGPAAAGIEKEELSEQLETGWERQAAGELFHLILQQHFRLAPRVGMGGDDQVLGDLVLVRLPQARIDRQTLELALGGEPHLHEIAARRALDFDAVELSLQLLHFRLKLRCLLRQIEKIH